jgi:hypothetical protein
VPRQRVLQLVVRKGQEKIRGPSDDTACVRAAGESAGVVEDDRRACDGGDGAGGGWRRVNSDLDGFYVDVLVRAETPVF